MGAVHPIMWSHETLGGRAIYSALGHPPERWDEAAFVDHVVGAVTWALRP
jgi:type 1 glutamine amidotransferase